MLSSVKTEPPQQSMGGTKASSGSKAGALHKPLQQLKPQVSMDSTHFMQQQSQIFVFSTELANKAAESVLSGQYKSIISFHCDQPGTKQMLQVRITTTTTTTKATVLSPRRVLAEFRLGSPDLCPNTKAAVLPFRRVLAKSRLCCSDLYTNTKTAVLPSFIYQGPKPPGFVKLIQKLTPTNAS